MADVQPGAVRQFRRFSEVTPRAVEWLWPNRIALGKLALLQGDPGLGKSLISLDLCARLSRGRAMPAQVKSNLGPPQASLTYQLVRHGDLPPALSWIGPSPLSDERLNGPHRRGRPSSRLREACAFLELFLADGPSPAHEIWKAAREHVLSARTLARAKAKLKIRSVRVMVDQMERSYWLLPDQQLPAELDPKNDPNSLEPWLAPMRERFPEASPLDKL